MNPGQPGLPPAAAPLAPTLPVRRLALRLAHWTLAGSVLACLWLYEGGPWHLRLGYVALAVAAWRVATGLAGPAADRFTSFVHGPSHTLAYLRALLARRAPRHLGHNPLGAWMIVALLAATLLAGVTGALYDTDRFWGYAGLYRLHQIGGWAFAVLVPLHLGGVLLSSILQRENLVRSMIDGQKRAPAVGDGGDR